MYRDWMATAEAKIAELNVANLLVQHSLRDKALRLRSGNQ